MAAHRLDRGLDLLSGVGGAVPAGLEGGVVVHDHFKPNYGLTGLATPTATLIACANSRR
jgi:hypothetical protein